MRILVVGSGGREHALAWKLARSPRVTEVISAPGNPGLAALGECVPVTDVAALTELALARTVDLTVVGPEAPLVAGIADVFAQHGLRVFGPTAAAAEIEGSKVFARELAERHGIPIAAGAAFDDPDAAAAYAEEIGPPVVVKAEGLAAGKGVLICRTHDEARTAVDRIMRARVFGEAGSRVVVEEFLPGRETSIFALTDGEHVAVLEPAQDYKRALDGDKGLNTGGMGSYSPVPWLDPKVRERAVREIVEPAIRGLAAEGRPYVGCLYAGLMITEDGPRLIEFNARFGDPETQALLPRLDSDLLDVLLACLDGTIGDQELRWRPEACVSVVVASGGYPQEYATGLRLEGVEEAGASDDVVVFHAGTARRDGGLVTAGGRVLNVTAFGATIPEARARAYEAVARIALDGAHYRTDIAEGEG